MRVLFYFTCLAALVVYALRRGGAPERAGTAILLVGSLLSMAAYSPLAQRFTHVETGVFAVDVLVLASFAALALRCNRSWTLWMVALQLVGVLAHVARLLDFEMPRNGYGIIIAMTSYPMLLILALAVRASSPSQTPRAADAT